MSSTNKTTYYELPQYTENDIFNPLADDNDAYEKIDTALHNIADAEADDAADIVSIKNRLDSAEGDIDALEAQNGSDVLTTVAQTLSGAVNELKSGEDSLDGRLDVVEDDINNVSTGLKAKVSALETQNGSEVLTTTAQTLSGAVNELLDDIDAINNKYPTPQLYGAKGDGIADDTQAFIDCFAANKKVYIPDGTYNIDNSSAPLTVQNNSMIVMGKNAMIAATSTDYPLFKLQNKHDIIFVGGILSGTNDFAGTLGQDLVLLDTCYNIVFNKVEIKNSCGCGIYDMAGYYNTVEDCYIHHNAAFGFESNYHSHDCVIKNNRFIDNGKNEYAGSATFSMGRGIVLAQATNIIVDGNTIIGSSEYGIRLYSDSEFSDGCESIIITNNIIKDNYRINLYLYCNGNMHNNVIMSNNIIGNTLASSDTIPVSLEGTDLIFSNNKITSDKGGLLFYNASGNIIGNIIKCVEVGMNFGGSTGGLLNIRDNDITCKDNQPFDDKYTGSSFINNVITHVGTIGSDDVGIHIRAGAIVKGNIIKGFYHDINLENLGADDVVEICDNHLYGETGGSYMFNMAMEISNKMVIGNNQFINGNPCNKAYIAGLITGGVVEYKRKVTQWNTTPSATQGKWNVGDLIINSSVSANTEYAWGWICTTASDPDNEIAAVWRSLR